MSCEQRLILVDGFEYETFCNEAHASERISDNPGPWWGLIEEDIDGLIEEGDECDYCSASLKEGKAMAALGKGE
ncbi:hypothetical protein LCGC14_0587590 [marine sediment metagenome]|uniref:Uncharacterized protein n=1 Tax=marine sediment metagenome TaxID=412755 RepID=A0A0F9U0K4_9ZZZZ